MMRIALSLSIAIGLAFTCQLAFACSCVPRPPGLKSEQDFAKWRAERAEVIFEGTAESAEIESNFLKANVGDIVPADLEEDEPSVMVRFRVTRSYRGPKQQDAQLWTGFGGDDCGIDFELGKQYLVYADREESGRLTTGICSSTAPLEDSEADLAYLRGNAFMPKVSRHVRKVGTGKLCICVKGTSSDLDDERILLYRVGGSSPIGTGEAESEGSGTFCANSIEPGKYRLLFEVFEGEAAETITSFTYYPGVQNSSDATVIKIEPGRTVSDLVFNVPAQPNFFVKGRVSTLNSVPLPIVSKVILISVDQPFLSLAYSQDVAADGSFTFPKVLPGRYWTFVDVDSQGEEKPRKWSTRKGELTVDGNFTGLALTLRPD